MHQRCGTQTSGGFNNNFHPFSKEFHRRDQLGVRHRQDVFHALLDHTEGQLTEIQRQRAVSDRTRWLNTHDLAFTQRLLSVISGFRLNTKHLALRTQHACRQGATRQKAAAAQTHQQIVEFTDIF